MNDLRTSSQEIVLEKDKINYKEKDSSAVPRSTNRKSFQQKLDAGGGGMVFNTPSSIETDELNSRREKAKRYGDTAQRAAQAESALHKAGNKALRAFQKSINAERSSLIFIDNQKDEFFFYLDDGSVVSFPLGVGVAGWVQAGNGIANIKDVYADERFNRNIDKQTGFVTKSMLCAPVRSKDGLSVIAIIQLMNKRGGQEGQRTDGRDAGFTREDEAAVEIVAAKVNDELDDFYAGLAGAKKNMKDAT